MQRYEFKVIPAPRRGEKARDAKTPEDRFALALTGVLNQMGREGWDYVRADTLPFDERSGLTGTKTKALVSGVADFAGLGLTLTGTTGNYSIAFKLQDATPADVAGVTATKTVALSYVAVTQDRKSVV